jgi:glucokinase
MATVGVDLGGTKLLAGAVSPSGELLHRVYRRIGGLSRDDLLRTIEAAFVEVAAAAGGEVTAAGFGIPSMIDRRAGVSVSSNHLPLDGMPFAAALRERLGLPVAVDNDGNCAALAEWRRGAAAGASHVVLLTLGTGIGGGLVLDGRLYRGALGAGAEMGHMVVDADGPRCFGACPGRGCLEALASGSALARDAAAAGLPADGAEVTRLARAGDAVALSVLSAVGERLGAGLAGLAMVFNPEVIVVGGGVMAAGELLLAPAREELARRAMEPALGTVRVVAAALGEEAGMIGAALMAAEEAT